MANLNLSWPTTTDDDGTGQTGTNTKKSFFDSIKSAIEGNLHSSTNPTIKNKTIIDEVVEARGTTTDLSDRIDDVITEDGALILPSSIANLSQLQEIIGNQNLVRDGNFWNWSYGISSPTRTAYWERGGASPTDQTLERTGYGATDTTQMAGQFCLKVTQATSNANYVWQHIVNSTDWPNFGYLENQYISAGAWCKCSTASAVSLQISDWNQATSSYHTGGGAWEWITVTHKVSPAATKLGVVLKIESSTTAHWSGVTAVLGSTPPSGPMAEKWRRGMITMPRKAVDTGVFVKLSMPYPAILYYIKGSTTTTVTSNLTTFTEKWNGSSWLAMYASGATLIANGANHGGYLVNGSYDHRCLSGFGGTGRTGGEYCQFRTNIIAAGGNKDLFIHWYFLTLNDPLASYRSWPSEY
jgi:hypothetical protein